MILEKDGITKDIRTQRVIARLESQGWYEQGTNPGEKSDELTAVKAELDALGVKYHPKTGLPKLTELLAAEKAKAAA